MSKEGGLVLDADPFSSMRKPCRKTSNASRKKYDVPKGSTPKLKVNYFLTVEGDSITSQDH